MATTATTPRLSLGEPIDMSGGENEKPYEWTARKERILDVIDSMDVDVLICADRNDDVTAVPVFEHQFLNAEYVTAWPLIVEP